jgi:hypothetical protein
MLIIPRLQNQVIDYIWNIHSTTRVSSLSCFHYIYDNTSSSSPLRRVMVVLCAQNVVQKHYPDNLDKFPKEMLLDLVELFAKRCKSRYTKASSTVSIPTKESFHVEVN